MNNHIFKAILQNRELFRLIVRKITIHPSKHRQSLIQIREGIFNLVFE